MMTKRKSTTSMRKKNMSTKFDVPYLSYQTFEKFPLATLRRLCPTSTKDVTEKQKQKCFEITFGQFIMDETSDDATFSNANPITEASFCVALDNDQIGTILCDTVLKAFKTEPWALYASTKHSRYTIYIK